jgi:hypothetical protein
LQTGAEAGSVGNEKKYVVRDDTDLRRYWKIGWTGGGTGEEFRGGSLGGSGGAMCSAA